MSKSAYGTPVAILDGDKELALERVPISNGPYNERFIQELAFNHPSCLPVREIDRAYEHLVPICMELYTQAGPLDALYATPTGRLVVLEAKLWRNPESRRKVVAQVLDYAKELSRWDYEDLQRQVSRCLGRKGNALYELVKERYPDVSEDEFVDEVQQSLKLGRFLLLILGDGIREGAATITDFIGSVGSLEFTFGLVELAMYRNDAVGLIVQPRVIARTVDMARYIVRLPEGAYIEDDVQQIEEEESGLSETARFYRKFWTEFLDELRLDDASQPMANVTQSQNIYFRILPSVRFCWISAYFSKYTETVGVYLRFARQEVGDTVFHALKDKQEEIEEDLGFAPEWSENDGVFNVGVSQRFRNVHAEDCRPAIKAYFSTNINQFVNVFRPRILRVLEDG